MAETLWTLRDASLRGRAGSRLAGVSLDVREGITAVVGPSGAGKTSLLNLLVDFEQADAGEVRRTLPEGGDELPLYWVPEDGGLWPHLSAMEHLRTVAPSGKAGEKLADEKLAELLSAFDIADRAASRPDELSQGERARLAVARALAARATVLVMDEPFVNVDLARQGRYWDAVRRHLEEGCASLVFATHSPKAVLREAERAVCLKEGRVIASGEVGELYWRPATREIMDCLGEGNWLSEEEARLWLGEETDSPGCFRPEQIRIEADGRSGAVVRESSFQGALAEVELEHEKAGARRRFYHRPSSDALGPGDRVAVRCLRDVRGTDLHALAKEGTCG